MSDLNRRVKSVCRDYSCDHGSVAGPLFRQSQAVPITENTLDGFEPKPVLLCPAMHEVCSASKRSEKKTGR